MPPIIKKKKVPPRIRYKRGLPQGVGPKRARHRPATYDETCVLSGLPFGAVVNKDGSVHIPSFRAKGVKVPPGGTRHDDGSIHIPPKKQCEVRR